MSPVTHQTIKLSKGKHNSPEEGACVMELASMLAGEPFSDHPASVCPVIGSFLRAYNDSIDDDRRQDLYAYAARVVGSRASADAQRARADCLAGWAADLRRHRWRRSFLPSRMRNLGLHRQPPVHALGTYAVHAISKHDHQTHAAALALIDQLLAIGSSEQRPAARAEVSSPEQPVSTPV
jgi:hypothetical protein